MTLPKGVHVRDVYLALHWSQMFTKVKCHAVLLQWQSLLGLLSWELSLYIWTRGSCRFQPQIPNLQMSYNNFTMVSGYQSIITASQHYFRWYSNLKWYMYMYALKELCYHCFKYWLVTWPICWPVNRRSYSELDVQNHNSSFNSKLNEHILTSLNNTFQHFNTFSV